MMQQMRGFAKSWVSSLFLLALALSFGVWGIGDMLRGRSADPSIATVGDVKIPPEQFEREYRNMQRRVSQQEGHDISAEEAHAKGLDKKVLEDEISTAALDQAAANYGLLASDAQVSSIIRAQDAFHGPMGTFDHDTFLRVLAQNNLTEDYYISLIRGDLTRTQLLSAAGGGMQIPDGYAKVFFKFVNEWRAADYVEVSTQDLPPTPVPADAQLSAYLKAHAAQFSTPEYRDVTYLAVGPDDVAGQLNITDAQLRQRYDAQKDQYQIPEKRDVEQIVFPDQASAKEAYSRIQSGAKFEDVAKAQGKSAGDISLGSVAQADLGPDRGPPTFALASGGVTQPVKFTFGWALLHVTAVTPAINKSFDDVKATLRKQAVEQLAAAKITDISNAFEDARAGGASFTDAAAKVGMHVIHVPAVDRNGLTPAGTKADMPNAPEFESQLARADVGEEGDPFSTADGHAYAIRVNGVTPSKLKPLDTVRAQVIAAWTEDQRRQQLAKFAADFAAKANREHSLAGVADQLHTSIHASGALNREAPPAPLSQALVRQVFAVPGGTAVFAPGAANDTYIVARVTGVNHLDMPADNPMAMRFAAQIAHQAGSDVQVLLANAWRDKLGSSINQSQFDRLSGGS